MALASRYMRGDQRTMGRRGEQGDDGALLAVWQGMTVRTADGVELGAVVGVFESGPCAGRLRVQGAAEQAPRLRHLPVGADAVFAIPRTAIAGAGHEGRALHIAATAKAAYDRWLMHVILP